ncbi:LuxR C-terminal-related transcriptional regulator [Bradyrhizobium cenepequi]
MTQEQCPLNKREIEIVRYLAEGDTAKAISNKTGLTEFSVAMQIKIARRIVSAKNATHLAAMALRKGWIE